MRAIFSGALRRVILLLAAANGQSQTIESRLDSSKDKSQNHLTAKDSIKQACVQSVNSSSTLLTLTVDAIVDTSDRYQKVLSTLISLLEEQSIMQGAYSEVNDQIIELRLEVANYQKEFNRLLTYMTSVEKVVEATVEAAFSADADYACKTLCERSHSASTEVNKCKEKMKALEDEYLNVQVHVAKQNIQNSDGDSLR